MAITYSYLCTEKLIQICKLISEADAFQLNDLGHHGNSFHSAEL